MSKYLFILGAKDPEMQEIEDILQKNFTPRGYALCNGAQVRPDTAYKATHVLVNAGELHECTMTLPELMAASTCLGETIVSVECGFVNIDEHSKFTIKNKIDHHNPGDKGYGRPPEEYWECSSLGQVMEMLYGQRLCGFCHTYRPYKQQRIIAAADHCLEQAYRGNCPQVVPSELFKWRLESRAKFQKRPVESVMADVRAAMSIIEEEKELEPGLVDLRGRQIAELPEAAAYMGVAVLAGPFQMPDGRLKYNLLSCTEEQGNKFLNKFYIPELDTVYGDPCRGIVGGYFTPNFKK
jgi:hypothetical protein